MKSNKFVPSPFEQLDGLNGDILQENEKTKPNKELSSSPDVQQKNALNNDRTNNKNGCENGNVKPRTLSVGDEKTLARDRFGSLKMLQPDEDRILKEMVCVCD